jgi:phosphopantothenoylcysteine decarboxylase / phosphopantothenate---cysteine ligase
MQTILIGVTSGIAAFKVVNLVKFLRKRGFNVIVIMTEHAKKMISSKEFEKASGNKVATELFPPGFDYKKILKKRKVEHISLADRADVICIVPATANAVAKIANGIADDLLSTTILASKSTLLVCPSMNVNMWNNKVTQDNISKLMKKGAFFVMPEKGRLACGYEGKGRLASCNKIEEEIVKLAEKRKELRGKKIIVTAGGTEEEIDEVRVITNKSSGKMGIVIAEELSKRGAIVTLIRGRTDVEPTVLLKDIRVSSAKDMFNAIKKEIKKNDAIIHAAAVSDFSMKEKTLGKISSKEGLSLELTPTTKIFEKVKSMNKKIFLVGFKAEYKLSEERLKKKAFDSLKKANADMIVANDVGKKRVFGSDYNEVIILDKKGNSKKIKRAEKRIIAEKIVDKVIKEIR